MEPRKKDVMDFAIPIMAVIFAFYMSLHMAVSYEAVKDNPVVRDLGNGEYSTSFNLAAFATDFTDRITNSPNEIVYVESTPKFILGTAFVCFLVIGYVATSQKKFINGKEYGTSAWGTPKQIAHLKAANLLKAEIKSIKRGKS